VSLTSIREAYVRRTFLKLMSFNARDARMGSHIDCKTFPLSLQSKDPGQLLDVIDLLRSQGISHYIRPPPLIVFGGQSSGKNSVLEAVSGVRFPMEENLCTRFTTDLVLRRDSMANATVAIIPSIETSDKEKEKLLGFMAPTNVSDRPGDG